MKRRMLYLILGILITVNYAFAETSQKTLDECISAAMTNNSEVIIAQKNLDIAYGVRMSAIGRILPKISSSGSYGNGQSGVESYSYGISASQPIFSGFSNINNIRIENENVISAEAGYIDAKSAVIYDIKNAYIGLYKAQEYLKMSKEISERRKIQVEIVKVKFDSGREHKGSYLTSKALITESHNDIASAQRDIELKQMQLSSACGLDVFEGIQAVSMFDMLPTAGDEPDYNEIVLKTPAVIKLKASKNSASLAVDNAGSQFMPGVSASGSYSKSGNEFLPQNESWRVGLNISMPVFEGFANITQLNTARVRLMIAEINESQGIKNKIISLKTKWNQFKSAEENLEATKEYVEAANARAEIAQAQYSAGLLTYDSWILIENDLVKYKKSYLDAMAGFLTAQAAWEYEKGVIKDEIKG